MASINPKTTEISAEDTENTPQVQQSPLVLLLAQNLPARQVLCNQELAGLIVDSLDGEVNADRKALVALTTLNPSFFNASTDAIWRSVPSLSPFLRLLPELYSGADNHINSKAWSRFRLYSPKTVAITLEDDTDIEKTMPLHWFHFLLSLPSKPALLFPKATSLTVRSLNGLNTAIPFELLGNLLSVTISDFSVEGSYETTAERALTSLMAALSFNAPRLSQLVLHSPLYKTIASAISEFPALATTSLVVPLPVNMEDLVFLNRISSLRTLSLSSGQGPNPGNPSITTDLDRSIAEEGKATVVNLNLKGHGRVIFCAMAFLSSPTLCSITCSFLKQVDSSVDGIFVVPYMLHRLSHTAPKLRKITFERLEPRQENYIEWYEGNLSLRTPDDYIQDFARLGNLTHLYFKYIPFLDRSFSVHLVAQLPNLPHLNTLCLLPLPGSKDERHKLELPTLECLQTLSSTNLTLQHLTISLDMSVIPSNTPSLSLPGHGLKELFIQPYYHNSKLPVSTLVTISTYLDRLFPRILDITSFFEEVAEEGCNISPGIRVAAASALNLWEGVAHMIRSYQVLRETVVQDTLVRNSMCVED